MRALLKRVQQTAEDALQRATAADSGGGGTEPPPVQLVYVAPSGSDVGGNGSFAQPFQTISHAEASITDATAIKPYVIMVAPGIYPEAIAQKSFVSISGVDPSNKPRLDGVLSFAVGFVGGSGLSKLELTASQTFDFAALVFPTYDVEECVFDLGTIFQGTGGYVLSLRQNQFGGVTITDAATTTSEGNTYRGLFTLNAATRNVVLVSSDDAFGAAFSTTATAPHLVTTTLVSSQVTPTLNLTGAGVSYQGTAGAIPPVVNRAGGAPAPVALTSANGLAYTATTVANWSGVNPSSVQNALDRIAAAAAITPIP
jgi:hypothetical protein